MDSPLRCPTLGLQGVAEKAWGGAAAASCGAHQPPALLCGICPGIALLGGLGLPVSHFFLGVSLEVWGTWEVGPKLGGGRWSGEAFWLGHTKPVRKPEQRGFFRRPLQIAGRGGVGSRLILTMYWEVAVEEETKAWGQNGSSGLPRNKVSGRV